MWELSDPVNSENNFHEMRMKIWQTIDVELGSFWLITYSHNHFTTSPCSTYSVMGSLKLWYNHLQSICTILETFGFPENVQELSKSAPAIHSSIKFQQKPTIICLTIYKHSTNTKLYQLARFCVGLRGRNSRNKTWNLYTR